MENRAISVAASSAELNWFCFPWPQQVTDDIIARTICRADKLSGWVLSVEFYWKITALDNDTPIEADVAQFIIQLMPKRVPRRFHWVSLAQLSQSHSWSCRKCIVDGSFSAQIDCKDRAMDKCSLVQLSANCDQTAHTKVVIKLHERKKVCLRIVLSKLPQNLLRVMIFFRQSKSIFYAAPWKAPQGYDCKVSDFLRVRFWATAKPSGLTFFVIFFVFRMWETRNRGKIKKKCHFVGRRRVLFCNNNDLLIGDRILLRLLAR